MRKVHEKLVGNRGPVTSRKLRGADGKYLRVGNHAVVAVEEYNGWKIVFHEGRYQATKRIDGGAVVETPPVYALWQARRRVDWWNRHAKQNYGIENRPPREGGMIVKP